jgi:hypothetical protein
MVPGIVGSAPDSTSNLAIASEQVWATCPNAVLPAWASLHAFTRDPFASKARTTSKCSFAAA